MHALNGAETSSAGKLYRVGLTRPRVPAGGVGGTPAHARPSASLARLTRADPCRNESSRSKVATMAAHATTPPISAAANWMPFIEGCLFGSPDTNRPSYDRL